MMKGPIASQLMAAWRSRQILLNRAPGHSAVLLHVSVGDVIGDPLIRHPARHPVIERGSVMGSDGLLHPGAPQAAPDLRDQLSSAGEAADLANQPRCTIIDCDDLGAGPGQRLAL